MVVVVAADEVHYTYTARRVASDSLDPRYEEDVGRDGRVSPVGLVSHKPRGRGRGSRSPPMGLC